MDSSRTRARATKLVILAWFTYLRLTGLAMYYHYRDEIAAADKPQSVDEKCAHEFGADYEKTERWKALKAGLALPTPQEAELLHDKTDQS